MSTTTGGGGGGVGASNGGGGAPASNNGSVAAAASAAGSTASGAGGAGAHKGRSLETQTIYTRQAVILRKNIWEWDRTVRSQTGEDWPKSLGRLNAALNQCMNMNASIDDVMEHFVYLPKKATANPQDVPFFLSTRLEDETGAAAAASAADEKIEDIGGGAAAAAVDSSIPPFALTTDDDPVELLTAYEKRAARMAAEFEQKMVRF